MKKRGYLFMELIVVMGLFSVVIFPLIMLMDKNIKSLNFIMEDYEVRKITENLEIIFEKILKPDEENLKFFLKEDESESGNFILINEKREKITKLRNVRINSDIKISVEKKKIFAKDIKKEICSVFVLEIKTRNKIKKKILSVQSDDKG